jgi:hypothetical protein
LSSVLDGARDVLSARGPHAAGTGGLQWRPLVLTTLVASAGYGAIMGLYEPRAAQVAYSALKVPLLLGVALGLCFASFFVINTLLGLRDDLWLAVRGILCSQATVALCLISLAPVTGFAYVCGLSYPGAKLMNGIMFAFASLGGQVTLLRHYRALIAKDAAHRRVLRIWLALYVFVAIQFAWILRPFIGSPDLETRFFREDAWGNAYVEVLRAAAELVGD